jgi:3-hydroxyisobutyrate dehydrogenase-like beta-hydroxyacid dehydrogenase
MTEKVGIIGVGIMGTKMNGALREAGYDMIARDIDPEAEERAEGMGATVVKSPAAVARETQVILLSLPGPDDVEEVLCRESDGILSVASPGHVVVDLSTVDPFSTRRNFATAREKGVGFLDSPVMGRPGSCGKWTFPTGGEAADLDRVKSILDHLAANVPHVGPSGNGNVLKLCNNLMFGAINAVTAEVLTICAGMGINPRLFFDTIAPSSASSVSPLFKEVGGKILDRDYTPLFSIDNLIKDMRLGIEMGKAAGVELMVAESNQKINFLAREDGLGAEDTAAVVKVFERLCKFQVGG